MKSDIFGNMKYCEETTQTHCVLQNPGLSQFFKLIDDILVSDVKEKSTYEYIFGENKGIDFDRLVKCLHPDTPPKSVDLVVGLSDTITKKMVLIESKLNATHYPSRRSKYQGKRCSSKEILGNIPAISNITIILYSDNKQREVKNYLQRRKQQVKKNQDIYLPYTPTILLKELF